MNSDDQDIIYILEDDDNGMVDSDESPRNFASYDDNEREEEEQELRSQGKAYSAIGLLFRVLFNPVEGWKVLRRSKISIESLQSGCFYPLLAFLAISKFADFFYSVNVSLSQLVTEAVIAFVSYFFAYFSMPMVVSWCLPKNMSENFEQKFGKEYTLISLSTLALFSITIDILPMLWPLLIFLPIWTLYVMFKGVRFFKFPADKEMRFFIISGVAVIGIPLCIEWLLNAIMPY